MLTTDVTTDNVIKILAADNLLMLITNPVAIILRSFDSYYCKVYENLHSPSKHGRTINSTNQNTNTNQIKTKTVTEQTENT